MANRIDIDVLRLRCISSLDAYHSHATTMFERAKYGERPPASELQAEQLSLYEYARVRRELLDALDAVHPSDRYQ